MVITLMSLDPAEELLPIKYIGAWVQVRLVDKILVEGHVQHADGQWNLILDSAVEINLVTGERKSLGDDTSILGTKVMHMSSMQPPSS